jgi:DNA-binding transcriptional ArsR family regulator
VPNWRDELIEAVKTKAEREAEDLARHKKRVEEALTTAEAAMALGVEALRFARDKLRDKGQEADLSESTDSLKLSLREVSLALDLVRDAALIKITFGDGKPREFDFAKDRHIAPADVEEYIGRRALEFVRAAQKATPW